VVLHLARIARSSAIAVCTAIATTAIAGSSANPALATSDPPPLGCEPIDCAAAYVGVPRSTLAADSVNETFRTGTLGTQVAIDQLDAAMADKLSAIAPEPSASLVWSYWLVIANHDAIRDAVLNQAGTDLCPQCGS
jgi:hypothetical protein